MRLIKLIHPIHGIVSQQVLLGHQNEDKIKTDWMYKYGKKFLECTVEIDCSKDDGTKRVNKNFKKVKNIITGDIYNSINETMEKEKISHTAVWKQCTRRHKIGFSYYLKYA